MDSHDHIVQQRHVDSSKWVATSLGDIFREEAYFSVRASGEDVSRSPPVAA